MASLLNNTRRVCVCVRSLYIKPKSLALHILYTQKTITIIIIVILYNNNNQLRIAKVG